MVSTLLLLLLVLVLSLLSAFLCWCGGRESSLRDTSWPVEPPGAGVTTEQHHRTPSSTPRQSVLNEENTTRQK
ncbi:hypothetical protein SRHO_G00061270 [Serrasalmus rhombeus]